ncbi:hypothetical protein K1T71_002956 [Dendrolimus kikuchii]|uniref:Uncharacterized protein n=1 Tax=Dendrolimus kikuchii TaxID=765133 RepID=A0ACC1DB39_9NEOP|nr:hypothetical protein K1T71_002956 [Dendrolimus kikuchii]
MNVFIFISLYNFFILISGETDQSDSDENDNPSTQSIKDSENFEKKYRRFFEDLDDEEWHVAHLRDQEYDFRRREDPCGPHNFEERIKKYRNTLKNDPSLVEFVSAFAIPVNESTIEEETCKKLDNNGNVTIYNKVSTDVSKNLTVPSAASTERTSDDKILNSKNETVKGSEGTKGSIIETYIDNQATTPKAILAQSDKMENKTDRKMRRSEYQFSSVEYYDETMDFDISVCPSTVEEITLEIDQIRHYDVECEKIILWKSLEAVH